MDDLEYDLIDELYFIQGFERLQHNLGWNKEQLVQTLHNLQNKGWVKCVKPYSDEVFPDFVDISTEPEKYYFLATKTGLLAHNTK